MIDAEKRKAVYLLSREGMSVRELVRRLSLSRKAVRKIIAEKGEIIREPRADRKMVDRERLTTLFVDCQGFIQRIHEKLKEEDGIEIGYSTLTRLVREFGLGASPEVRDAKVPDVPGAEMQHDTSPYDLKIGGHVMRVHGSSLYLRYSKIRYLRFYPAFNRFRMKCFFHEALDRFGYSAPCCIIDNTNLAVLRGSGKNALMVPEMIAFAKQYQFIWQAHEIKHSDRKGGVERGFWFVETNFFPGRTFSSIEDLNQQALQWATERIPLRAHAKSKLIPAKLFEFEKAYLQKNPPFVSPPVLALDRDTDQYGYAAFEGNYYWVPGRGRGKVQVLQFAEKLRILQDREVIAEYAIVPWGTKNERIKPPGLPEHREPRNRKQPTGVEENRLTLIGPDVAEYLKLVKASPESSIKKYRLIRQLFRLSQKLQPELFIQTIKRANHYRVTDIETIERMAIYLLRESSFTADLRPDEEDERAQDICREGDVSELPDFSKYDNALGLDDEESEGTDGKGS